MTKATNITWHQGKVSSADRESLLGQKGAVLWFTGLSGSGKSSVSREVEEAIVKAGKFVYVLDGDNIRHGLNANLGFSAEDRKENIRRVAEVARLFFDANVIVLTAFISPYRSERDLARSLIPSGSFFEVHCAATVEECEARDPKGLYKKARSGGIPDFTGVTAPYEAPDNPELLLQTGKEDLNASAQKVVAMLREKKILS